MLINHDFSRRASVTPENYQWVCSPQAGVDRIMLDRIGEEKARATSIVRYHPNTTFPEHAHPDGEEIYVISGTFSEGDNDYPAGWYMRNPPDSTHRPASVEGAVIFVKLRQMGPGDNSHVRLDTNNPANWFSTPEGAICPLFENAHERVSLRRMSQGRSLTFSKADGGAEILLLEGQLSEGSIIYATGSWIRLPPDNNDCLVSGDSGAVFYLKTGHLKAIITAEGKAY